MMQVVRSIGILDVVVLSILSSLVKICLILSYHSTDFEVHRNWLAITHSLPTEKWYLEKTSEWTLDYPPFFAWFEYFLSMIAVNVDPQMVKIENLNHKSTETIYFQRFTVIFSDFLLHYSVYRCSQAIFTLQDEKRKIASLKPKVFYFCVFTIFNAGLLMVDHMHFQYNGFLFGILFLSLYNMMEGNVIWSAFWFSILLNFKHIFLYVAPAYGIFLLRSYCMDPTIGSFKGILKINIFRVFSLGAVVIAVFAASFVPFMANVSQVFIRLFPFKRGLTHAYWAPNFWALYNAADKMLTIAGKYFGLGQFSSESTLSRGLIGDVKHNILPEILPLTTAIITLLSMMPVLLNLWFAPNTLSKKGQFCQFLRAVVIVSTCSFMFGWHVHEKAILMVILPLTILVFIGTRQVKTNWVHILMLFRVVGHYKASKAFQENVTKVVLTLAFSLFSFSSLKYIFRVNVVNSQMSLLSSLENIYLYGLLVNEIYCSVIHNFMPFGKQFEFIPLMLTSVYCAFGILWCWLKLYYICLFCPGSSDINYTQKTPKRKQKQK